MTYVVLKDSPLHYAPSVFDPSERRPAQATGEWVDVWTRLDAENVATEPEGDD